MSGGFARMEQALVEPIRNLVATATSTLASELRAPMAAALSVYVVWTGYMILTGTIREPMMEAIKRVFKACIVFAFATGASEYQAWFADPMLTEVPNSIAKALNGKTDVGGVLFDDIVMRTAGVIDEGWKTVEWGITPSIRYGLLSWFVQLAVLAVCVIAFIYMMFAKMALGLVLALGPIFIGLALFDATRRFAESFVGVTVSLVILQALIAALQALVLNVVTDTVRGASAANIGTGATFVTVTVVCILSAALFVSLPSIAAALGGGGYLDMRQVRGSTASATQNAWGSAKSLGQWAHSTTTGAWKKSAPGASGHSGGGDRVGGSAAARESVDRLRRGQ